MFLELKGLGMLVFAYVFNWDEHTLKEISKLGNGLASDKEFLRDIHFGWFGGIAGRAVEAGKRDKLTIDKEKWDELQSCSQMFGQSK